jgi:hypothetical protein
MLEEIVIQVQVDFCWYKTFLVSERKRGFVVFFLFWEKTLSRRFKGSGEESSTWF